VEDLHEGTVFLVLRGVFVNEQGHHSFHDGEEMVVVEVLDQFVAYAVDLLGVQRRPLHLFLTVELHLLLVRGQLKNVFTLLCGFLEQTRLVHVVCANLFLENVCLRCVFQIYFVKNVDDLQQNEIVLVALKQLVHDLESLLVPSFGVVPAAVEVEQGKNLFVLDLFGVALDGPHQRHFGLLEFVPPEQELSVVEPALRIRLIV